MRYCLKLVESGLVAGFEVVVARSSLGPSVGRPSSREPKVSQLHRIKVPSHR